MRERENCELVPDERGRGTQRERSQWGLWDSLMQDEEERREEKRRVQREVRRERERERRCQWRAYSRIQVSTLYSVN